MTSAPKVKAPEPSKEQLQAEKDAAQRAKEQQEFMERMSQEQLRISEEGLALQREQMKMPEIKLPPPAPPSPAAAPTVNPASPGALGIPLSQGAGGDDAPVIKRPESDRLAIQKASLGTRALSTRGNAPKVQKDKGDVGRAYGTPQGRIVEGKVKKTPQSQLIRRLGDRPNAPNAGGQGQGQGGKGQGQGGKGQGQGGKGQGNNNRANRPLNIPTRKKQNLK